MNKKILVITGAGASKSLTDPLPPKDKVPDMFFEGDFRELPTGAELIQKIIAYQDKSISWLIAYLCYHYFSQDINSESFFKFAREIEKIINKYSEIEQAVKNDNSVYDDYPQKHANKIAEANQDLIGTIKSKILADEPMKKLLNSSIFLQALENDISNDHMVGSFLGGFVDIHPISKFPINFANAIFFWLLYYVVAYKDKEEVFKRINQLLEHKCLALLDLILHDIYAYCKAVLNNLHDLFSFRNVTIFHPPSNYDSLIRTLEHTGYYNYVKIYNVHDAISDQVLNKMREILNSIMKHLRACLES